MKFNELPEGAYFTWKGKTYRKLPLSHALNMETDVISDFGHTLNVVQINKPKKHSNTLFQYLNWALIQAYRETYPTAISVTIKLDLKSKTTTTSIHEG